MMKKATLLLLVCAATLAATAQSTTSNRWDQLDSLLSEAQYATAYPLAQGYYRQAEGTELLTAAFYLTMLDEGYSEHAADSALLRYGLLARQLRGMDRAVAYALLFDTYNRIYSDNYYRIGRRHPSDDPNLRAYQWHAARMEDTLLRCADSVLAYAAQLRTAPTGPYARLFVDDTAAGLPPLDSSLLGLVVQTLLNNNYMHLNLNELPDTLRPQVIVPLATFGSLPGAASPKAHYLLRLHHRVAQVYTDDAETMLWLDLKRYDLFYYLPRLDSLVAYYQPRIEDPEMKALLGLRRAQYQNENYQRVEAERICFETEHLYPGTYGAKSCRTLRKYSICQPEYRLKFASIESSRRSRMAVVEARNIRRLHFRIVEQIALPYAYSDEQKCDSLMTLKPVKEWEQTLPDSGDHNWHEYLVALPPVPQGNYVLLAYWDSTDSQTGRGVSGSEYFSSDATFITYTTLATHGRTQLWPSAGYVVNRLTGQPIAHHRVTLHGEKELTERPFRHRTRTDREGHYSFSSSSPLYWMIDFDQLSVDMDGYEFYYTTYGGRGGVQTWLRDKQKTRWLEIVMTDRPVYRVGDTVRFSCVAYRKHTRGKEQNIRIRPAKQVKLIATFGQQYEKATDTLRLTTDEHGRCHGQFVIPAEGENGRYCIEVQSVGYESSLFEGYYTTRTIKVEAYKPPHFMVTLSATRDSGEAAARRFGQPITLYGSAISYSGAPMSRARVKWEVSREKMLNPLTSSSMADEYPHRDSLTVDDEGNFQFTFTPEKDTADSSSATHKTTYIYTAYVRVMDADGELHEQHLSFHVSDADGYCMTTNDDLSHLTFVYNNFDHQPLQGNVRVEMYQLRQPDTVRTLETLQIEHPKARWTGSKAEFHRLFPYRAFSREEGDRHSWPVVAKRYDSTTADRTIVIPGLPSGLYRVVFHTPDGNQHDTLVNYVATGGRVTGDEVVWLRTTPRRDWIYYNQLTCKVGDTVRIELGSPYGNQPLYYRVCHAAKIYQRGMMVIDSSHTSTLLIPITKKMKDGCTVHLSAVREGCSFTKRYVIRVVRPDQVLTISTETFRDRLQPGTQERWTFRIADGDSAAVAANLCLSLYDRSLEQYNSFNAGFWPWTKNAYMQNDDILETTLSTMANENLYMSISKWDQPQLGFALMDRKTFYDRLLNSYGAVLFRGTVVDAKTQEPVPFVNIVARQQGHRVAGTTADMDGNFSFKRLPAGLYDIVFSSVGYSGCSYQVVIRSDQITTWTVPLRPSATALQEIQIVESKSPRIGTSQIPVIEIGTPESGMRLTSDDISHMPGNSVESIVASVAGIGYARGEDGMATMRKRTGVNVPKEAIAEISTIFNFGSMAGDHPTAMRKNLSTLAFFEPALRSDKEGRVSVQFTLPDALTQWQLRGFAWSDRFQIGSISRTIYSQRELMVQPLMPRFLRQGDTVAIPAKVSNLTDSTVEVIVGFEMANADSTQRGSRQEYSTSLTLAPHSSGIATMRLAVPTNWHTANYKVYAVTSHTTGHHSDGEQGALPVLSNRERITTSHLLYLPGSTDGKEVVRAFDIALPAPAPGDSTTLAFNANPVQYVIDALPHFKRLLMPGNIYLANSAYVNHLTSLLDTTPKARKRAETRYSSDLQRLRNAQTSQGGWSWMPGGKEPSRYITESILQRIATCPAVHENPRQFLKAVNYLDNLLAEKGKHDLIRSSYLPWHDDCLSLLYTRSLYFGTKPLAECDSIVQQTFRFYYNIFKRHSAEYTDHLRTQGQLALLMLHMGDTADAVRLANRIKGTAHTEDDKGMYWRSNVSGHGWYQRPIETAALMVDVMADVLHDREAVSRIQQWILASKQGTAWRTDMATAAALRALTRMNTLTAGSNAHALSLTLNGDTLSTQPGNQPLPADTAHTLHFQLTGTSPLPAFGAVFHSHDTPIDSIAYNGTGLKLRKTLSRVNPDGSLSLLAPDMPLRAGDRIRVHIDIDCLQATDQMVLRDQRAAACEPVSTASGWKWNNGLRYYVDVRDERTDCYIDHLGIGQYYVEYDLWVRHSGTFTNGICTLQSVYAPEYRANTDSPTVTVR